MTGRVAKKDRPASSRPASGRRAAAAGPSLIYEITPSDQEAGSWKKWVKQSDLYEIIEENESE